jgi:large subunit ribosomal protein L35
MPKMKSHSGAKKRLRKTAKGKYKCQKEGRRHLMAGKSESRARRIGQNGYIHDTMTYRMDRMLPYA